MLANLMIKYLGSAFPSCRSGIHSLFFFMLLSVMWSRFGGGAFRVLDKDSVLKHSLFLCHRSDLVLRFILVFVVVVVLVAVIADLVVVAAVSVTVDVCCCIC